MKILWSDHRATVSAIDEEEVYIESLRTTKQSLKKIMQKRKKVSPIVFLNFSTSDLPSVSLRPIRWTCTLE